MVRTDFGHGPQVCGIATGKVWPRKSLARNRTRGLATGPLSRRHSIPRLGQSVSLGMRAPPGRKMAVLMSVSHPAHDQAIGWKVIATLQSPSRDNSGRCSQADIGARESHLHQLLGCLELTSTTIMPIVKRRFTI